MNDLWGIDVLTAMDSTNLIECTHEKIEKFSVKSDLIIKY